MIEIKAPNIIPKINAPIIFFAGSIEMGKAINWQSKLAADLESSKCICLNPRRDDWDSSWIQDIDNPQFNEQVSWELAGLEKSDLIIYNFDPSTQSPITLLELGLYANTSKKVIVHCPEGYFRKGNVDIVCQRYNVSQVKSYVELLNSIREFLSHKEWAKNNIS